MSQQSPTRASRVLGALHPWRWWITLAICAALLVDVLVLRGRQVLWVLGWVIPISFGLWFWGPIATGWGRAGPRAGKAFRGGVDGK